MNEFDFIDQRLRPLATHPGAHGLRDDGASLPIAPVGQEWRVTTDTLIAGVHFRASDPLDGVAWRALATSLSDLAAQLAKPQFYMLNLSLPAGCDLQALGRGFQHAQDAMGCSLLGGDTTQTTGPLIICVTAFGLGHIGANPLRTKARPGHKIGLLCAPHGPLGAAKAGFQGDKAFRHAYLRPEPCLSVFDGPHWHGVAAMADVSDGLLQDLGHICQASGVGAQVQGACLPIAMPDGPLVPQITWGDDYALVMTARQLPPLPSVVEIGLILPGSGVKLLDQAGAEICVDAPGYVHQTHL